MAFKILNDEEVSLLNDAQWAQYEKELDLYQQRVVFVERLEVLENAHVEPYEPELEPIIIINDLEVEPFEKVEKINPVLPPVPGCTEVSTDHIQKIEREKLDLPTVNELKIATTSFKPLEKQQSKLPTVISPSIPMAMYTEKSKNNPHYTPDNIPDIMLADININPIKIQKNTQIGLPKVPVCATETIEFTKPEKQQFNLPTVISPSIPMVMYTEKSKNNLHHTPDNIPDIALADINMNPIEIPKNTQIGLPEVPVCATEIIKFTKPENCSPDLPSVNMPDTSIHYSGKVEILQPTLPEVSSLSNIPEVEFYKLESVQPVLPTVSKVEIGIMDFKKPESKKLELPNVAEINIERRNFEKPEKVQMNISAPSIASVKIKTFATIKRDIFGLPEITIKEAPDAYAKLNELLFVPGEETEVLKG